MPEKYHKTAWCLVKRVYFQSLGNRQVVDPIFNNLIKVAMENATFRENMQTLEQSASAIEGNYNSFVSAASKFNNNFTYRYPGRDNVESQAEIPEEFPGQRPVGGHVECPTVHYYYHFPRNQKAGSKPNNNNFGHRHLGQSHAEIPVETPGRHHVECHVEHPMVSRNYYPTEFYMPFHH